MNVETCVAPDEDLLYEGKADELFPEKQREDLVGENIPVAIFGTADFDATTVDPTTVQVSEQRV